MKLHIVYGSPNCRKVQAVIDFLGLDVEIKTVDFLAGEHKKPDFLAINPNGVVPALEDGDFRLWESNAIMEYLCAKRPGNRLLPDDPRTRADISRWLHWGQGYFIHAASGLIFENFVKPRLMQMDPDRAKVAEAGEAFRRYAAVLDRHLAGNGHVVGDGVTLAELSLASPLAFTKAASLPLDGCGHIQAWYARLEADPTWTKSAPPPEMIAS